MNLEKPTSYILFIIRRIERFRPVPLTEFLLPAFWQPFCLERGNHPLINVLARVYDEYRFTCHRFSQGYAKGRRSMPSNAGTGLKGFPIFGRHVLGKLERSVRARKKGV